MCLLGRVYREEEYEAFGLHPPFIRHVHAVGEMDSCAPLVFQVVPAGLSLTWNARYVYLLRVAGCATIEPTSMHRTHSARVRKHGGRSGQKIPQLTTRM